MADMADEDDLVLSLAAQAALAEFLAEKQTQEAELRSSSKQQEISIDAFPEDWQVPTNPSAILKVTQLSQFWYDGETAESLAKELMHGTTADTVVAIISAPSVYPKIIVLSPTSHNLIFEENESPNHENIPLRIR